MAAVHVAKQSAVVEYGGRPIPIKKGVTRVEEGHELLKRYPTLFEPAESGANFRVETARQEPSTSRSRGRGRKGTKEPAEDPEGTKEPAEDPEGGD